MRTKDESQCAWDGVLQDAFKMGAMLASRPRIHVQQSPRNKLASIAIGNDLMEFAAAMRLEFGI